MCAVHADFKVGWAWKESFHLIGFPVGFGCCGHPPLHLTGRPSDAVEAQCTLGRAGGLLHGGSSDLRGGLYCLTQHQPEGEEER